MLLAYYKFSIEEGTQFTGCSQVNFRFRSCRRFGPGFLTLCADTKAIPLPFRILGRIAPLAQGVFQWRTLGHQTKGAGSGGGAGCICPDMPQSGAFCRTAAGTDRRFRAGCLLPGMAQGSSANFLTFGSDLRFCAGGLLPGMLMAAGCQQQEQRQTHCQTSDFFIDINSFPKR